MLIICGIDDDSNGIGPLLIDAIGVVYRGSSYSSTRVLVGSFLSVAKFRVCNLMQLVLQNEISGEYG